MNPNKRTVLLTTAFLLSIFWVSAKAQYQDTLWIPVTFYDFRSNGSNPEFEQNHDGGVKKGMVANTLDADGKPTPGPRPYMNHYIKYWFRDWQDSARGDSTVPVYGDNGFTVDFENVGHDTAFENIVIKDSLPFIHTSNGVYEFSRTGQGEPEFFWIDDRGFGNEGRNPDHNFSFTMELDWEFQMKDDLSFQFNGDDDVWVFIDEKLALDIGGIHGPTSDRLDVNAFAEQYGLKNGETYGFKIFYCERHTVNSTIKITTNIISAPPDSLHLRVEPNDTIKIGDTLFAFAEISSDTGIITDFSEDLKWGFEDPHANNDVSTLVDFGTSARFVPTRAPTTVRIWGKYEDAALGIDIRDTVDIVVLVGDPVAVFIENTEDSTRNPYDPPEFDEITIDANQTYNDGMYAILRDMYGNWVSPANPASWSEADTTILTASNGAAVDRGQGQIDRSDQDSGRTIVTVTTEEGFSDEIEGIVTNVTYDDIRIVVQDGPFYRIIDSLTIRTRHDTTLYVEGKRSDSQTWERIAANWSSSRISVNPSAPEGKAASWKLTPTATGNGTISVSREGTGGKTITDFITVTITHGDPDRMVFYEEEGEPASLTPLHDTIQVVAGEAQTIVSKLFDRQGEWLRDFEEIDSLRNRISWSLNDPKAMIEPSRGHMVAFYSDTAHEFYNLVATYRDGALQVSEQIVIEVIPGDPAMLVIEPNSRGLQLSPNKPQTFSNNTLVITSEETYKEAYAVLRDEKGNWVRFSGKTGWSIDDTVVAQWRRGLEYRGEVFVNRVNSGETMLNAKDSTTGLEGEIDLEVLSYYYTELQIITRGTLDSLIDSLVMNTNQDTTLYVIGLRSDTAKWEPVAADWFASDSVDRSVTAPSNVGSWTISPTRPATGWIRVSHGNDEQTKPDTVAVQFDAGPPTDIDIEITTPEHRRIAGEPITARITIENEDGPVPGEWCGSAVFGDILDTVFNGYDPLVVITRPDGSLDTTHFSELADICFTDGKTTVDFVLYYAPINNLHNISVTFDDNLDGNTGNFNLLPGPIDSIDLVQNSGIPFEGDSIVLDFNDGETIRSIGFDRFGNLVGDARSLWNTTPEIPEYVSPEKIAQIYYSVDNVLYESRGYIIAHYNDTINDSLPVSIRSKPAEVVQAFTRDHNGNGYLDAIEVHFDKVTSFPDNYDFMSNIVVSYQAQTMMNFEVESISGENGSSDSVFTIRLKEDTTLQYGEPQTAWTPKIKINNVPDIDSRSIQCLDGAGPVIWSVKKVVNAAGKREKDKVTVVFSEDITGPDGTFKYDNLPALAFTVWEKDGEGRFVQVDSMLIGVDQFENVGINELTFFMTNGKDLAYYHFLNIKVGSSGTTSEGSSLIVDTETQNEPVQNNRRVRVKVQGEIGDIIVGPNPGRPAIDMENDRYLRNHNNNAAREEVRNKGGTLILVPMYLPDIEDVDNTKLTGKLMIFDAIGNLVFSLENAENIIDEDFKKNILSSRDVNRTINNENEENKNQIWLTFKWNLHTEGGRPVAPGLYRIVVYLELEDTMQNTRTLKKYIKNFGVGR